MPFLFLFIGAFLFLRNPFSGKKYRIYLVKNVVVVARKNPEIVIRDYSHYVERLLIKGLGGAKRQVVIFYECPGLRLLKAITPSCSIALQIEHTLLKPEGVCGSLPAIRGNLPLPNLEDFYFIRIQDFDKLNSTDIVIDYSRINLWNIGSSLQLRQYLQKNICISPALYPLKLSQFDRDGIITLFGNVDVPRRKLFLESLKKYHVASKNISGVYFGVEKIYQAAKIVINIRQSDIYDTLEELRVLPALRSGAIVICENAPCKEKALYSKFVIWASLEEIPILVLEIEKNYEAVHQRIFGDGSANSSFCRRMLRIERCNELAVKRAIKLLNGENYNEVENLKVKN